MGIRKGKEGKGKSERRGETEAFLSQTPPTSLRAHLGRRSPQATLGNFLLESQPLASIGQALLVLIICTPFCSWLGLRRVKQKAYRKLSFTVIALLN